MGCYTVDISTQPLYSLYLELAFVQSLKHGLSPKPFCNLIGHRGAGTLAPENTLASFRLAKTLGLNWVEFDTQVCGSGEWVVIHDSTLDRTSNGMGSVEKSCLSYLKSLDAGSWFNSRFHDEPIPLLSEVLDLLANLKLQPNIEIKGKLQYSQNHLPDFLKILKKHWPNDRPLPLISSFSLEILQSLQQKTAEYPFGYLVEEINSDTLPIMLECGFFSLHCHHQHFQKIRQTDILRSRFPLLLYTVNEPQLAKHYFQEGVSAIFSDFTNFIFSQPNSRE